jgi:ribosomal protein S18 acetylase RimI-like enzyme
VVVQGQLVRRAVDVNWLNLALGHQVFDAAGATLVRNPALPDVYDANFVFDITASEPAAITALLARVAEEYTHAPRFTFRTDPFTPPAFEARLAFEGYEWTDAILLILEGPMFGARREFEIQPVEDDAAWLAYAELKHLDWSEHAPAKKVEAGDSSIVQRLISTNKLKCPPVEYVLAYQDGRAVGFSSTWEGTDGVGQVEDVFVHAAYRRRGIAAAMIHRCVEIARGRGAGSMVIVVDPRNAAKYLYSALGWRPLALCRQYGKNRR